MKVLIISHNPISTFNNMGKTFLNMFSCFSREDLCQLYVRPTIPDVKMCDSYFQITDKQALKSLFGGSPGGEVDEVNIDRIIAKRQNGELPPPPAPVGTKSSLLLIRDIVWKASRWYSKKLREWLRREHPTCIFLAPGYSSFIYDIAIKISNDYDLPIITYICDDYYFVKRPKGIIGKWHFSMLQKKTVKLMEKTSGLVVISEEISNIYHKTFGVKTHVIMTGAGVAPVESYSSSTPVKTFSYFGNLSDGRHFTLADIGHSIDEINRVHNKHITLNIYSAENSHEILSVFEGIDCVNLCGFVSGQVYENAFYSSDVLIHTESFDEVNIDRVKHSVSTKIADSLASGIPLFAYGPSDISSMKHLIRNDCAFVVTSSVELRDKLEQVIFDTDKVKRVVKKAVETSEEYHNNHRNSEKLKSVFADIPGV